MKDFTKKGTKLPVIPVGTKFRTVCFPEFDKRKIKTLHNQRTSMVSYGVYDKDYILCESDEYENHGGTNYFIIKLSTIERLAKEQGMYGDEPNIKVSLNDDTVDALRYLLTAIERKPKIIMSHNPIMPSWIFEEFITYKSNENMNPKVTLQENGTVTVIDTETTTTLSKVTVDEICRLVKEDGEKVKLKKNTWVFVERKNELQDMKPALVFFKWHGIQTYGFSHSGEYCYNYGSAMTFKEHKITPATSETVEQYLKAEAVKRGYKKGVKIKNHQGTFTLEDLDIVFNTQYNDGIYTRQGSGVWLCMNGVWSEIIQPETITRAEAEKRYDVK